MENQKSRIPEMTVEQAREANQDSESQKTKKKAADPRRWKPTLTKEVLTYQAKIRELPAGVAWLDNQGLSWAVEQHTHYIKEPAYNLFMTVKCRKTLGLREKCPICEQNWAVWRAAKTRNDKALMIKMTERGNKVSFIGNILVVKDLNNPSLNGEVKLWEHTKKLHDRLQEPLTINDAESEESSEFIQPEKKELFVPYHPRTGKNFIVIAKKDPDPKITAIDYNMSCWDKVGCSPIAESDDQILAILEKCYDLREFINDVPSAEDLVRRYQQFNDRLNDLREPVPGTKNYVSGADADSPVFDGEAPTGPVSPNAKQGDSKEYFKPADASEPPVEPEQDDGTIKADEVPVGEEDLPF